MYVLFDERLQEKQIAFQIQAEKGDEGGVDNYTSLYKACLDMLDQDFIMKVIISWLFTPVFVWKQTYIQSIEANNTGDIKCA
jgi:hypothetical protein